MGDTGKEVNIKYLTELIPLERIVTSLSVIFTFTFTIKDFHEIAAKRKRPAPQGEGRFSDFVELNE